MYGLQLHISDNTTFGSYLDHVLKFHSTLKSERIFVHFLWLQYNPNEPWKPLPVLLNEIDIVEL